MHIRNPRGTGQVFKTIWDVAGTPIFKKKIKKQLTTLDPFHEDSEYVFGFEIGQRESGFYSERTDRQSDPAIQYRIVI